MGETNSSGAATSVNKNHSSPFSPSSRAMGRNLDPVMNLVRNLMNIMTEFMSSYQPTSGIPVLSVTNSVEETKASKPSNHGQSKKPRLHSPKQKAPAKSTDPLDNQSVGGLAQIFPSAQWLGETQEDLEQQLDQLDCQGDVDPLELMEDGATSPFPTTNGSKRSEPMFNAPSKA